MLRRRLAVWSVWHARMVGGVGFTPYAGLFLLKRSLYAGGMAYGEPRWRVTDLPKVSDRVKEELEGEARIFALMLCSRLGYILLSFFPAFVILLVFLVLLGMWWGIGVHLLGLVFFYQTLEWACREGEALDSRQAVGWYVRREYWMVTPMIGSVVSACLMGLPLMMFLMVACVLTYLSVCVCVFLHLTPVLAVLRPPARQEFSGVLRPALVTVR